MHHFARYEAEKRRHYRPRRPRQDHPGGRNAQAGRHLPREPGHGGARHGLQRSGAGARHHHSGQEHRRPLQGREDQHRGHAGPRRFWRRGGADPQDGQRRHPAGGRRRGSHAPDPFCAEQGTGAGPQGHRGGQQGGPPRPAHPRGHGRGAGAAAGSERHRRAV